MLSTNMERIPACIRILTWNCCRKLLEAKKKGRMYGISTMVASRVVMMGAQERSDNDEVERLMEKIAELEQDKIKKHVMMEIIEEVARLYVEMNAKIQMFSKNRHKTCHQLKMR
ncbi:hypothetical protein HanXRQr2_Chr17g0788001 [Helianthus annuus]|uniref:Uncharacterized protein n=1 Tax=Helianthus annuus TaxID=4232 RepID=A0A251ULS4_HELAN|nr:uncharacterized protein LOC110938384 [Helianthus annuus]KAF5754150.1 hypothetical protein HanXRQr2_Chr17g0788001 [Helianthus annuus]KAJ0432097.1 hypothetical protein HanIR_Chr17g0855551 [Helianthus annuus]